MSAEEDSKAKFRGAERAAVAGDARAQFQLAEMYQTGIGCKQDSAAAYRWFLRSAEQEFVAAEYELAFVYLLGSGVERSTREAAHYLLRASKRGMSEAQFALGALLANGKIFKQSKKQATYWLRAAQAAGHESAGLELGKLVAATTNEDDTLNPQRVSQRPSRLDITLTPISEAERERCYAEGLKRGRECAAQGLGRYKRRLARKDRAPIDLDILTTLDAVFDLSLDSAAARGYLDSDSVDGIEGICDGSDPNVVACKVAFIDGIRAGVKAGIYGDEEEGID